MANTFLGYAIRFGAADSTVVPGFASGSFVMQDEDQELNAEIDDVKDGDGITVQRTIFNPSQKATFTVIPKAALLSTLATAFGTPGILPAIGTIGTVTNTYDFSIAATTWIVAKASKKRSNTKATMIVLELERFTGTNGISAGTS